MNQSEFVMSREMPIAVNFKVNTNTLKIHENKLNELIAHIPDTVGIDFVNLSSGIAEIQLFTINETFPLNEAEIKEIMKLMLPNQSFEITTQRAFCDSKPPENDYYSSVFNLIEQSR